MIVEFDFSTYFFNVTYLYIYTYVENIELCNSKFSKY